MSKVQLIDKRNKLLLNLLTCFYLVDAAIYMWEDGDMTMFWPPVGLFILLFLYIFLYRIKVLPHATMFIYILFYYAYMAYLLTYYPYLVNYFFLIFGIIFCAIYHNYISIIFSGCLCILLLTYFYVTNSTQIFSEIVETDFVYFILFAVLCMFFLLFYAKFANELWETAYENEKKAKEKLRFTQEEKKALDQSLRNADKLTLAGEMAASIAHEIRNPLASIRGFVQLIHEDNPKYETYTSIMLSELERVNDVIGEFLVLAKPQTSKMSSSSITAILNDVLTLFKTEFRLHNIHLTVESLEDDVKLLCDSNQLKQVFINLIKNSIESMPNGGDLFLSTVLDNQQCYVHITLKDTGIGIPEHLLSMIHKPFFTTKEQGTGLGLMVTNKIIEQHEGKINISSGSNQGTTVIISLPLLTDKALSASI
ncbi:ATP-binding protein [Priestia abyssalis]|uniref:ATP-binding protein n=1 Tax=Priestia abyssalis TaxID=1221450 RepID=UPI0009951AEE|nr:ATP-binding protein [Priestia abyssalis]